MPKKSLMKLSLGEEARRKKKNKKSSKTVLKRILPRGESYKVSIIITPFCPHPCCRCRIS
jgi:hypothetical protein